MIHGIKVKKSEVREVIKAALPNYKGRRITVYPQSSVGLHNLNWCEGTRSRYIAVNLTDLSTIQNEAINQIAPWENGYEGQRLEVPDGVAIVKHTIFQGCHEFVDIIVNGDNFPNLLPNHQD